MGLSCIIPLISFADMLSTLIGLIGNNRDVDALGDRIGEVTASGVYDATGRLVDPFPVFSLK